MTISSDLASIKKWHGLFNVISRHVLDEILDQNGIQWYWMKKNIFNNKEIWKEGGGSGGENICSGTYTFLTKKWGNERIELWDIGKNSIVYLWGKLSGF